jgi:aspartyl-tRNA(Asn)/glutamyl-tRNA(Gln) amidotransferase subunit A
MARFHQRYDLVLTACTPTAAFAADQPTVKPECAVARLGALDLRLQPDPPAGDQRAVGLDEEGMPRAVQVAAALYRDDLAFRAARALERAASLPLAIPP